MGKLSHAAINAVAVHKKNHPSWTLRVTPEQHPMLYQCLDTVSHDAGGGAGHPYHLIAPSWEPYLDDIEQALASLSVEDIETFSIGEASEAQAIADRSGVFQSARSLLNEWFDSEPEDHT